MTPVLAIAAGGLSAGVAPQAGGSLTHFRRADGVDLMRAASPEALAAHDPRGMASFPLVPFSGRIAGGRLHFRGRTHQLRLNAPPEGNALHGDGWQSAWQVEHAGASEVRLVLPDPQRGWPWPYTARQTYSLTPEALTVAMAITNQGTGPMPAGLGVHPWFDLTPGATLQFHARSVFLVDAGYLYAGVAEIPQRWDFTAPRSVAGTDLAHGFAGWDGSARIVWPERDASLTIEARRPFAHLVVYTPPGQTFFCVEPVSNSVDAFNLHERGQTADDGTVVLEPGETLQASARFVSGAAGGIS